MNINRRRFLIGLGTSAAIVSASNIMPISVWDRPPRLWQDGIHDGAPYLNWLVEQARRAEGNIVLLPLGALYMQGPIKMPYDHFTLLGNRSRLVMMSDRPAVEVSGRYNRLFDLDVERNGGASPFVIVDRDTTGFGGTMQAGPIRRRTMA